MLSYVRRYVMYDVYCTSLCNVRRYVMYVINVNLLAFRMDRLNDDIQTYTRRIDGSKQMDSYSKEIDNCENSDEEHGLSGFYV